MRVLVVDIGGTHVKVLASGQDAEREFVSGPNLTPKRMASKVRQMAADWKYEVLSIGYPGPVLQNRPIAEPWNLGKGWVGFNFEAAFKRPVKVVNDAVMQALGSYKGGKMLFLGLGTGLGSAVVVDVRKLKKLPPGCRAGDNVNAFRGGFRLWDNGRGSTRAEPLLFKRTTSKQGGVQVMRQM